MKSEKIRQFQFGAVYLEHMTTLVGGPLILSNEIGDSIGDSNVNDLWRW